VTPASSAIGTTDEQSERTDESESEPSGDEGDPPDPIPLAASAVACTVWFGPTVPRADERELLAMLGSRNGVAVLQWPRDTDRAEHCCELGIPTLCFVHDQASPPALHHGLLEWLPVSASDKEVHNCLIRLSAYGAAQRQAAAPVVEQGCLHLGQCGIHLDRSVCELAEVLVANFDRAVDDSLLSSTTGEQRVDQRSLFRDLLHLDRDANQLGLEVVPVNRHEHAIRRCAR
jgi:hypothetical protein